MELNTIDGNKINCEILFTYTSVVYRILRIPVTGTRRRSIHISYSRIPLS